MKTLEQMWQAYRQNLHGYDPDAEAELEAAFKSGAWVMTRVVLSGDEIIALRDDYEKFKKKRAANDE